MIVESYEDVIVLTGALRSNFWETIHTAISLTLKRHPTGVIIDCSGITEMTEEGAETFHDAIDYVTEHDRARIVVAAAPQHVLDVLRLVPEVRSQLPIAKSVDDARRSLDLLVEADHETKKKRRREQEFREYERTVVAIVCGDDSDAELLKVVREFASTNPVKVVVLFPIVVPRNLPLQAPMPEQESMATKAIDAAKKTLTEIRIAHEAKVEHARDLPTLIHEIAEASDAAYVMFAFSQRSPEKLEEGVRLVGSILQKVTRPIIFVRGSTA